MKLTKKEAIEILQDFIENPDDYLSKSHIPLNLYDAIETAIDEMTDGEVAE